MYAYAHALYLLIQENNREHQGPNVAIQPLKKPDSDVMIIPFLYVHI